MYKIAWIVDNFRQKNDRMINYDDTRRDITIDTIPGLRTQSRLIIREPQISDSGNYTCSASNTEPASIYVFVSKGICIFGNLAISVTLIEPNSYLHYGHFILWQKYEMWISSDFFFWYIHGIFHYEWTNNSHFGKRNVNAGLFAHTLNSQSHPYPYPYIVKSKCYLRKIKRLR